jgi:hypothetical protein
MDFFFTPIIRYDENGHLPSRLQLQYDDFEVDVYGVNGALPPISRPSAPAPLPPLPPIPMGKHYTPKPSPPLPLIPRNVKKQIPKL